MKKELDDHEVQGKYFDNAIPKDLIEFGMIPEFVGRFPVIESTKGLEIKEKNPKARTHKISSVNQIILFIMWYFII